MSQVKDEYKDKYQEKTAIAPVDNSHQIAKTDAAAPAEISKEEIDPYIGISELKLSEKERQLLLSDIADEEIEIRPDGLIYLPEIKYRLILNKVFGPGNWSIQPRGVHIVDNVLCYKGALYIRGHFVAEAIGEQKYFKNNPNQSYATAHEGAKSDCLTRCCKDLGIAYKLWDKQFVRQWIDKYAIQVWVVNIDTNSPKYGQKKKLWRKKNEPPINMWPWVEESAVPEDKKPGKNGEPIDEFINKTITIKQQKRLWAIAKSNGWQESDVKELFEAYGYRSTSDIKIADYDKIVSVIEKNQKNVSI